ncbi:hypothetical protein [Halobacteriovorax sp.]|uniref:hypothetical protein n=1 Tax=Halobacteriovorax sp. TaxID=2020862 RepID=UPI0035694352
MNIFNKSIILILLILLGSCFKQDAPEVFSDQTRTRRDFEQLKACSSITFYEGFLYRNNLIDLFVCTSWDKKFVKMFKALVDTPEASWNDLVSPIDSVFFGDRERRDRFIKYYQDLDKDGALDDLGRVITALTDTNFYDGINALFECAENNESASCDNRLGSIDKSDIKNLLLVFDRSPNLLLEIGNVIDEFNNSLGSDSEKLRREIVKFNSTNFFNKLRIMIVSKLAEKYIKGLSSGDLRLLRGAFLAKEPVSNNNWINQWVKRKDVTTSYVNKLVSIPVKEQPQLVRDFKVLNILYSNEVTCSDESLKLSIDLKSLVSNTIEHLKEDDIVKFFDSLILASESVIYARPICPDLTDAKRVVSYYEYTQKRNVNHTIDLSNVLKYSVDILAKMPTIDIVKFTLELVDYDQDYLVSLLAGDLFNVSNEINRTVVENSDDFYATGLSIIKRSNEDIFYSVAFILNDLFATPSSKDLTSWAKSWLFWNEEEQNFLFNFIDVHLDSNTNYVRLFAFYSQFLKELSTDWVRIGEYYNKDEESRERTFQSLKKIVSNFSGEEILTDYKKFFSGDHILELLKVLTSNGSSANYQISKLSVKNLDERINYKAPVIELVTTSERDNAAIVECAKHLSEKKSIYELSMSYPEDCKELNNTYFLDNLSGGLSKTLVELKEVYPGNTFEHLFEPGGILSPEMTMWGIGSAISIDKELSNSGRSIEFLFHTVEEFLFDIGQEGNRGVSIIKAALEISLNWLGNDSEMDLRNGAISELVHHKDRVDEIFQILPEYINEFEEWNANYVEKKYVEDSKYSCRNYINIHVGGSVCPSEELAKENINSIVKQMVTRYEDSEGIPIEYILKAALPNGGLQIPLDHDESKNKRLTLYESFNYLYDLSDKSLKVNREKVKYRDSLDGDKLYYTMTTSERIDHVIRNVSFRDNYLGVQYLNAVVKGDDYTDVVKEKQRLMGVCLNTPGIRCGKSMTKDERRKGKNAYWAYDGLVDVNNGNDLEPRMKYGELMQAFMYSFVASSALEAQEVKLFPLDDHLLKKHNGKALGYISEMAGFSNLGRVVHDRVGRTREEFLNFVNSAEFKRVNDMLLSRVSEREIIDVFEQLLNTISSDDQDAVRDIVEWINELDYSEVRKIEEIVAKSIYISTYLGSEEQVYGTGDSENFKNSTSFEFIYILNQIMNEYKLLKNSFDAEDFKLKNTLSPTLNFVSFLYEKLSNVEKSKKYWFILNSTYSAVRELMFIRGGVTSFVENIIKKSRSSSVYKIVSNIYKYLIQVEKKGTKELREVLATSYKSSVGMDSLWNYVENTSIRSLCSLENESCVANDNYDDLRRLSYVLSRKDNLEDTLDWLLVKNKEEILNTVNDFFPYLKIVK